MSGPTDPNTTPLHGSLSSRLAALGKPKDPVMKAVEVFAEADEVLQQAGVFFDAVRQGDALGIESMATTMGRAQATRTWFAPWLQPGATVATAWEFWFDKISLLAKQQDNRVAPIASHVLEVIDLCRENGLVFMQLRETLFVFERPCRLLHTKGQVGVYLEILVKTGYVERTQIPPRWKSINWEGAYYFPKRNLNVAMIGWPSVVRGISRIRNQSRKEEETLRRLEPLLEQSTLPSDPQAQGLTNLLRGETSGSMAIWDHASKFGGQDTGLLAVLLGRFVPDLTLPVVLMGILADTLLPEAMTSAANDQGHDLPPIFLEPREGGGLRATFGRISGLNQETHQAMMRIERLIQWRVNQENKPQQLALPRPTNTSS